MKNNVVRCPLRYTVNLQARHVSVRESFVLRLQSDSEHELTDLVTSLCCLGFPLHLFCGAQFFLYGDQTRPYVGVLGRHSGTFCFLPSVPEVFCRSQAVQADLLLRVSLSLFSTDVGH